MTQDLEGPVQASFSLTLTPLHQSRHPLKTLHILPNKTLTIGRTIGTKETFPGETNGYYESKAMSRRHCILFSTRDGDHPKVFIQDLGTLNGTFLNGTRLGTDGHASVPTVVKDQDRIVFAQTVSQEDVIYEGVEVVIEIKHCEE